MAIQALIVDDNPTNLIVLQRALEIEGVVPVPCNHPNEVVDVLDAVGSVDLVFLDLEFPNHDGLHLIHNYRQDPRLAEVPFVAYTVHISEQNQAAEAGFHSFLGKPLAVDRFHDQLQQILSGQQVWDTGQ